MSAFMNRILKNNDTSFVFRLPRLFHTVYFMPCRKASYDGRFIIEDLEKPQLKNYRRSVILLVVLQAVRDSDFCAFGINKSQRLVIPQKLLQRTDSSLALAYKAHLYEITSIRYRSIITFYSPMGTISAYMPLSLGVMA